MRRGSFSMVWGAGVALFWGAVGGDLAYGAPATGDPGTVPGKIARAAAYYVPCLPGAGGELRTNAPTPLLVTLDTSQRRQTMRGFGASDAWSTQFVGQWPPAKREAIAELLFGTALDGLKNPKGIGLSIWRFNLGAGSSRQNDISDNWRRADTFLDAAFAGYDWSRCPGSRWFLQAARSHGVTRFIAFVNSPPINMTKNGLSSCRPDGGTTNLQDGRAGDFAAYLATILRHFRDVEGIDFEGISPFNEPNWDWDSAGQEGCRYSNADIQKVVVALHQCLQEQQLDTQIELPEAGDLSYLYSYPSSRGDYVDAFLERQSPYYVGDKVAGRICSHSYYTCWPEDGRLVGWRQTLRAKLDQYPGLGYSMTEYCILIPNSSWVPPAYRDYGTGRDLGIDPALWLARVIHYDLTVAEASDWQWWLALSPYDYKDGLVYVDKNPSDGAYYPSKMLWALGNFSRFIRPGMTRLSVRRSDNATPAATVEDLMISAYWKKDDGTVVVVCVNRAHADRPVKLAFAGVHVGSLIPYVTRGSAGSPDNLAAYRALGPDDTVAIPARSVVTLVATPTNLGDWDRDGKVDLRDLAVLATRWRETSLDSSSQPRPAGWGDVTDLTDRWLTDFRLAARWRLDERSGTVARDEVAGADGALQGAPAWAPGAGKIGGALRLDGGADCIQTPFVLDPAARGFSAFAWVRGGAPGQVLLAQTGGANWLRAAPDGTLKTELQAAGRGGKILGCASVITDGLWHRVGLVWDGSRRLLYVDDVQVASDTQPSLASSTGGLTLGVGSSLAAGTFWKGVIDDVCIYDRPVKP